MIKAVWEPNGSPSTKDLLAKIERMRQKCLRERHIDEEYYTGRLNYLAQAEADIHALRAANPWMETEQQRSIEMVRELSATNPWHFCVVTQRLREFGYESWEADKLVQYASFIQSRSWEAFYPEDAAFLKQKYADAGIDAEKIDFGVLG